MTQTLQKITLSPSRDIPFDRLVLSQSNVRKIKASVSVEELAEDIARRGLLQCLSVRPVLAADGSETGKFEIPVGGRRFQALSLLVKQKRLAKTAPIPCIVREAGSAILAEDDSLAENVQRVGLHPLDQFRAFAALREKGLGEDEVAAAFFVAPQVVKQRLRLAAAAPALLEVYAEEGMTLEQLMAFTVNPDHGRQLQVWDAVKSSWSKEPYQIRRMLTETSVRASDRRAVFVGIDAYEEAGGTVLRDLFQGDEGGWLEDPGLLDRLVAAKLQAEAERIASEGWKWTTVSADLPYGFGSGMRRLTGQSVPMTEEERLAQAGLLAEYQALEAEYSGADDYPEEIDTRLGDLEAAMAALDDRPIVYDPAEVARSGVFVSIGRDGDIAIHRGYMRAEDEIRVDGSDPEGEDAVGQGVHAASVVPHGTGATVITPGGQPTAIEADDEDDGGSRPLPERLVSELTAHRTLALREAIGRAPQVALTLLLLKLVNDTFRTTGASGSCLEVSVRQVYLPAQAPDRKDSPVARAFESRHAAWEAKLPLGDDAALWDYLTGLDEARRMDLLAHCLSLGINALQEKVNPYVTGISASGLTRRIAQSDLAAKAVTLDMVAAGWEPTVETYLGRVPKARILEAVREAKGEGAAQLLDHLKKSDMAVEAEHLLEGSGWLPEVLRRPDLSPETAQVHAVPGAEPEADVSPDTASPLAAE